MATSTPQTERQLTADSAHQPGARSMADISLIDDGHEFDDSYRPGSFWAKITIAVVCVASVGVGAWFGISYFVSDESESTAIDMHSVALEDLLIKVTESGTLESANNTDIKCEVAGGSTILYIIPDGETVAEAGVPLVVLDSSAIEEQITQQEIVFERAQATAIQAEKNVAVASINVREYEEGTYIQELQTLDAQVTVAEENLRSARNTLEHTERMFRKGYATPLELEAQKFAVQRGELDLKTANTARNVLVNFTKEKMLEDLKSQLATAQATLKSENKALELEQTKLDRLRIQLDKCTIKSPKPGMVVYASEERRRGNDGSQIAEGAAVREQQTILRLPDLTQMQVKVEIHEADVNRISMGDRASVTVMGDKDFRGTVNSIANQPVQSGGWFSDNIKKYEVVISVDADNAKQLELKPGLTAKVVILLDELNATPAVPLTAIVEGHVWVKSGEDFEMRKVGQGPKTETRSAIESGLSEGDVVVLDPRSAFPNQVAKLAGPQSTMSVEERFGRTMQQRGGQQRGGDLGGGDMGGGDLGRGGGARGGPRGGGGERGAAAGRNGRGRPGDSQGVGQDSGQQDLPD